MTDTESASNLLDGNNESIGIGECGGVWVVLLRTSYATSYAQTDSDPLTLKLTGTDVRDILYAGASQGVLSGQGGADDLIGSAYADSLDGGDGDDSLVGGNGNDTLTGGAGNDTLVGGNGTDTAIYSENEGAYVVVPLADGSYRVSGPNGTDSLIGIEQVQFGTGAPVALSGLMTGPAWFSTGYYLEMKAEIMNAQQYAGRTDWTAGDVLTQLTGAGLTPYQHYELYGSAEGLNPNTYFDQAYYLQEKAASLNNQAYDGRTDWTAAEVAQQILSAGLSAYDHFARYGANEGLDPSASFDVETYLTNKANALNAQLAGGQSDWTPNAVLQAIESAGLDPVSHYILYGQSEGLSASKSKSDNAGSVKSQTETSSKTVAAVFHFGDSGRDSDAPMLLAGGAPTENSSCTTGLNWKTTTLTFEKTDGTEANPKTVYYGGTVAVTADLATGTYTVTLPDGRSLAYDEKTEAMLWQDIYTGTVQEKNGSLGGGTLGAEEATVVNLEWTTIHLDGGATTTCASFMEVNDANATFDAKDIIVHFDSTFTESYDLATGLIDKSLF